MQRKNDTKNGFTLVEMLVVLVLLSLLCSLAIPSLVRNWRNVQMDYAIQQLHHDIRWAQRAAEKADQIVTINFYRYKQPYTYSVRYAGSPEHLRRRELPDRIDKITAETIIINRDKRIQKNGHILLQKGECKRYVYYYQTGRTRVSQKAIP